MTAWAYRVFDESDRLIYVGSTTHLWNRLAAHQQSWWAFQAARVRATVHPTIALARECERRVIATENPRWNVMGRWAVRGTWSVEDYRDYLNALAMKGHSATAYNQAHIQRAVDECQLRFGVDPRTSPLRLVPGSAS